jgi:FMN-dependent NADH-azoreductase
MRLVTALYHHKKDHDMQILHIDSSILGDHSVTRQLSAAIVARLRALAPTATVTHRDVAATPLPQFTGAVATGRGVPADQRSPAVQADVAILDQVVAEVFAADTLVIGAPMYNFGIPSQLKAWLDALAVAGTTFRFGPTGAEGLLGGRRVIIASARGGLYGADTPLASLDHQETHLRGFFGFLGITDVEVIRAEGVMMGPEIKQQALAAALRQTAELQAA